MFGQPRIRNDWPWGFKTSDLVHFGKRRQLGLVTFAAETEEFPGGEVPVLYKNERRKYVTVWVPADDLERVSPVPIG